MYYIVYISTIIGLAASLAVLIFMHRYSGRFFGHTLSQWVARTRRKDDEISADKLLRVRKLLECLAHDVLKHRLLGLHSLFEEMRQFYGNSGHKKIGSMSIPPEKGAAFRDEFFRLCGLKARPEERLWIRFRDAFLEICHYTGRRIAAPVADPMFADTVKVLFELRRAMLGFVNTDIVWANSSPRFYKILSLDYISVYPETLSLAAGCRMEIDPETIVRSAIETVAAQTGRAEVRDRIHICECYREKLLCDAPMRTLIMCLARLLDNALEQSQNVAIGASFVTDDFTGVSKIIFKVYDESPDIPDRGSEGMGIRGARQSLETFSGGLVYRSEARDAFKKAAVISISAACYEPVKETKIRSIARFGFITFGLLQFIVFVTCFANVLGGPPVEFAGQGTDIVEFYAEVGQELTIPLCSGGRNVRAEVRAENAACTADNCTLPHILALLEPCKKSLNHPDCPKALHWVPLFNDGQRQGRNYELSVDCIADGPPPSKDARRIRVRVMRPNSPPKIAFAQVINDTKNTIHYITNKGETLKVDINDKLRLRLLANDADADAVTYRLRMPDGNVVESADGLFDLVPQWSAFATSTFVVGATDNLAPPETFNLVLTADKLHPIEIETADVVTSSASVRVLCDGTSEARVCHIPERNINEVRLIVRFDPLQTRIRPVIEFQTSDNHGINIRHNKKYAAKTGETQLGDQWEVYSNATQQLIAVVELTNIEKISAAGAYAFTFRMLSNVHAPDTGSIAVYANVSELSERMSAAKMLLIFAFSQQKSSKYVFTSQHLRLREYENEQDADAAQDGAWIYPVEGERLRQEPAVTSIACQTPEFSAAFETPQIRNLKNAWRIDFKLKRGCIAGLVESLSAKQRLCAARVRFGANMPEKDIWIMLESRQCAPRIESLALASDSAELSENIYRYRFAIVDTDGDLGKNKIEVRGNVPNKIDFEQETHRLGNAYVGQIVFSPDCNLTDAASLALVATDETGLSAKQEIVLPQTCPSNLDTADGKKRFEADEGRVVEIPIVAENGAKLSLKSRFGSIENGAFRWLASCSYGAGPHRIEIRDAQRAGARPLVLEIALRCMPRLSVSIGGAQIPPGIPVEIAQNTEYRIKIEGADVSRFDFSLQSSAIYPVLRFSEIVQDNDAYTVSVSCSAETETEETMQIQVHPKDESAFLSPDPIVINFLCLAPQNAA